MRQRVISMVCGLLVVGISFGVLADFAWAQPKIPNKVQLLNYARTTGEVRVIVELSVPDITKLTAASITQRTQPPGKRSPVVAAQSDANLEAAIASTTDAVISQLHGIAYTVNRTYKTVPFVALNVSEEALTKLESLPDVVRVVENRPIPLPEPVPDISPETVPLELHETVDLVGASDAWTMGYTGEGWYVAVLDSGIRRGHEFFAGKTIDEACFSSVSHCPNGQTSMQGIGAAVHHPNTYVGYDHGTHVVGIAAGQKSDGSLAGIAKDADIIAVQVFSKFSGSACEPYSSYCVKSYPSDQLAGLEYIYTLSSTHNIAAVNMSLGGGQYASDCDDDPRKTAIDNLRSVGIATVIASGNNGFCHDIGAPACISHAIAVGATDKSDQEASFSNWQPDMLDLFAPGQYIYSSIGSSDSSYQSWAGTSMATPHVTGAWALLKQAKPTASVSELLQALQNTGYGAVVPRCGTGSQPRIQIDAVLNALSSAYTLTVEKAGNGSGIVTGSDIHCGSACTAEYSAGTTVTLTAEADPGSVFVGWSGAECSGTGECLVTMESDKTVTATFQTYAHFTATYGGSDDDKAYSIQLTRDGGYIMAGTTRSFSSNSDAWILKLAPDGSVEWQKTYGGAGSDGATYIQQTVDDGYIVAATTNSFGAGWSDAWILKLASDGNVEWQKTYGGVKIDTVSSIQQTNDGGYIAIGKSTSFIHDGYWILKLAQDGTVEWEKKYGSDSFSGPTYYTTIPLAIRQTNDGGYIAALSSNRANSTAGWHGYDIWLLKLDSNGNVTPEDCEPGMSCWQKTYDGSGNDYVHSVQQTDDGGYIVLGRTNSFREGSEYAAYVGDMWLLRLDANGNVLWDNV